MFFVFCHVVEMKSLVFLKFCNFII
jgi:hypothetical protein